MRGGVGELVGAGDIAHGEDIRKAGGQIFIGFQRAVVAQFQAQLFNAITLGISPSAHRN